MKGFDNTPEKEEVYSLIQYVTPLCSREYDLKQSI
jgi:hypothetical protein